MIAVFVVVFLAIHPFQDGNGRLSRALTTLLLLRAGYAYVQYNSFESVIEQSKDAYYLALRRTQGTIRTETPDWQPWLSFFSALAAATRLYSHSIVAGGFPEMSYVTRETPRTSFMMRRDTWSRKSYGNRAQRAVMKSTVSTARSATT